MAFLFFQCAFSRKADKQTAHLLRPVQPQLPGVKIAIKITTLVVLPSSPLKS
jgi:hypothetical protein